MLENTAVVIIGRNEGKRLESCLGSLVVLRGSDPIIYVDSGSSDNSVAAARAWGAEVVELDPARPFSAARARNEGFARALCLSPGIKYVQFVDGDCELVPGWLERAVEELEQRPELAVVCGRRRERFRDATVYNRLCDMEWDTPIGEARACGGDAMMRVSAFEDVEGFNPDVIAGEEPELCFRLRQGGWEISRLDHDMTLHDAAIHRFGQWWKRSVRGGYAYSLGKVMHGKSRERYCIRDCRRIWLWGLWVPLLAAVLAWPTHGWSALLFLAYGLLMVRVYRHGQRRGWGAGDSLVYAGFTVLSKWPGLWGMLRWYGRRLKGSPSQVIEYKEKTVVATA